MEKDHLYPGATYVALYRVSTSNERQALSVPFQKEGVKNFINRYKGNLIEEFYEEITATIVTRKELEAAIKLCLDTDSSLIVNDLSRLSRAGIEAVYMLDKAKVRYFEISSPYDSKFNKNLKLIQAENDNTTRKKYIKQSLDQIKRNIKKDGFHVSKVGNRITGLGNPQHLTEDARDNSILERNKRARDNPNNKKALTVVKLLLPQKLTLGAMANFLNANDFNTSKGNNFTATSVSNLLRLYGVNREVGQRQEINH